jgi:ATP-dependent Clp protease ATP-binding subunit ClpB
LKKEKDEISTDQLEKLKEKLAQLQQEYKQLESQWKEEKNIIPTMSRLNKKIEESKIEEEKVTREGDLGRAAELKYKVREDLKKEMARLQKHLDEVQKDKKMLRQEVSEDDIAKIVAQWTNIPISRLMEGERSKLLKMEERLKHRVIGQDHAISVVSAAVRRARSGIQDPNRPIGSFIFLGPTGVGKTETAKALAEFLFDNETALIRVDMSEYMEKHSVARLIGAPPGYVGYDEGGYLTEAIRTHPYAVILFDEIEKAHPDVFNILLQILDDGRLTDGKGRTVDFKNTVLIMTSNLGSELMTNDVKKHANNVDEIRVMLKKFFRPEFLNRIDEIVVFEFLDKAAIQIIVDIQIQSLNKLLKEKKIQVQLSGDVRTKLAEEGFDPEYGARPLKRTIQRLIQDPLSIAILEGKFLEGTQLQVNMDAHGNFQFDTLENQVKIKSETQKIAHKT